MGVYAAEALQSQDEDSAHSALERQARARPHQWRQQHGYVRDADFAFTFSSYEDALALPGRAVADAWAEDRRRRASCMARWRQPWQAGVSLAPHKSMTLRPGSSASRLGRKILRRGARTAALLRPVDSRLL